MKNTQPSSRPWDGLANAGTRTTGSTSTEASGANKRFAAHVVLIHKYLEFVRYCAATLAHGAGGEDESLLWEAHDLLVALEEEIRRSVPDGPEVVDRLEGWQADLIHLEPETPAVDCLVCRRGKQVPDDLPPDYAWALRSLHDAA